MKKFLKLSTVVIFTCIAANSIAQSVRYTDKNTIGWYGVFSTFNLNHKWGVHAEYQWRRADLIKNWQQSLLRVGINYKVNPRVLFRVGYAWAETFAYGEIPLNSFGKNFTEHRLFEMAQLSHKEGIIDITHRFMLEQRFVGKYNSATSSKEETFPMLNRARYMLRLQAPLTSAANKKQFPYAAVYDEILIGFGKNVGNNVFDQNRIGLLVGYKFNDQVKIEGGFLNQTLQLARRINNQNIFQSNSGLILSGIFNFNLEMQ